MCSACNTVYRARRVEEVGEFQVELEELINRHSIENGSDTPDRLLAEYLVGCINIYNQTVKARDRWYDIQL